MELNEGNHAGEFVLSTANGGRSFDNAVVASGAGELEAGTVLALSGTEFVQFDEDDSAAPPVAILRARVDATSAAADCVVLARDAEVNGKQLVWPDGIADLAKAAAIADLADLGIIVR